MQPAARLCALREELQRSERAQRRADAAQPGPQRLPIILVGRLGTWREALTGVEVRFGGRRLGSARAGSLEREAKATTTSTTPTPPAVASCGAGPLLTLTAVGHLGVEKRGHERQVARRLPLQLAEDGGGQRAERLASSRPPWFGVGLGLGLG